MNGWVAEGLTAAARVMLGDGMAARLFDGSRASVQASFLGLAMAVFMDAGIESAAAATIPDATRGGLFFALMGLDLAAYAAAVATILVLTREPEHRARFPAYLAAINWGSAALSAAFALPKWILVSMPPVRVEGSSVSGSPLLTITIVMGVIVASFIAHYRICHHVLGVSGVRAFWMVVAAIAASATATAVLT